MAKYNFDKIIDRSGTDCIKYDKMGEILGYSDVLPMWVADMDFETPEFIIQAIQKRSEHSILGYSFRSDDYHNSIVNWLKKRHNWSIQSSEISFCPGVVPGLFLALKAFTLPGDEILIQPPVYFPFFSTVEQNNRVLVQNPLVHEDLYYRMDFEDLKRKIGPKTKMIFLSNPHNPVGRAWTKEELSMLVDICYEHKILIISDEIHSDLIFAPSKHQPVAAINSKAQEITLTFMAPSKTFNMAGLSTSFVVAQNPDLLKKYNEALEATHLRMGNIFGNVATQAAYEMGEDWLEELLVYLQGNIDLVSDFAEKYSSYFDLRIPEATYLLWLDYSKMGLTDKELRRFFFEEAKIGINPGIIFGSEGSGFIRMNVAMPRSLVLQGLNNLARALEAYKS